MNVDGVELQEDEDFIMRFAASRILGMEGESGTLIVTTRRIVFRPTLYDRIWGSRTHSVLRDAVTNVEVSRSTFGARVLRVTVQDAPDELFRVERKSAHMAEPFRDDLASRTPSSAEGR